MDNTTTPITVAAVAETVAASTIQPSPTASQSAVMTTVNLPDFEAEYEKTKQKLSFFEDTIAKKKELDDITKSVEEQDRELNRILDEKSPVACEHDAKMKEFELSLTAFKEKEEKWCAEMPNPHHVLYEPMQGEYLFAQKEKIAAQIKMTKDNLAMLEARLQLDDELLLLHPITKALNELEGRVANKERDIQRLNEQKRVLVKEFDDAVSTWRSKYLESTEAGSKPERAPETEPKTTKLESLDKVKASKVQPPQQKNKQEISDLQNQISLLRKKIVSIEGQDCRKQPIVEVGLDILARKIELSKPRGERDEAIIEQGNKAAHNGTALADARRLLLRRAKRDEEEWTWYEEEYGASPDVVSKIGSDSPKALEILDWRFSIRSFDTVRVGLLEDFEILFVKVAGALKSGKSTHNKAADMNLFLETDTGKQIYDKMKTLYLAARKYRKTFRS